ncbi:MAG: T9SS type A sorting domain-containing protein [Candidatus Stygibacter australis]|nr:T9SS type A sorting domain-containing protein [Candidatus Stygibacter australis]
MKKQIMCIFFLVLIIGAFATTIYIPEDYATIQEGINASEDGDEIIVSPGTYIENINLAGKAIILGSLFYTTQDTSYISQTIIDGNQDGSVVTFESEEDSTSVLIGFTITNGQGVGSYPYTGGGITCINYSCPSLENVTIMDNSAGWYGGGIYCESSSPSLENVTITGNSAGEHGGGICCCFNSNPSLVNCLFWNNSAGYNGGGICCLSSSPSLESVTITDNSAGTAGGGIHCESSNPILDNVTITGNSASFGGGICCSSSNPSLDNVTITGNSAEDDGGGVYCWRSRPILMNVTITDNLATCDESRGGGIYCNDSSPILEDVTITDNFAITGGGIHCISNSRPSLANVIISGNSAFDHGGGIYCWCSSPSLMNVTITNNSAERGGGIYCWGSSPSFENVTISDNSAVDYGGGINCYYSCSPSLMNVTISGNSADYGGGITCINYSYPILENVTIMGNSADYGGGIYCVDSSSTILMNCILWNNSPQEVEFHDDYLPNTITIAYSDIDGGEEGIETYDNGTVNWLDGNIDADPLFVDAELGDYHLTENSPCIDTGIAYFEYEGYVLVDLSEDEYWGIAPDMGAYEYGMVAIEEEEIIIENEKLKIENYPNPFNPETQITFNLPEAEYVNLSVYNLKGQLVKLLADEILPAGKNSLIWNGRNATGRKVSSGVYLVRFKSSNEIATKKIMLIK